MTVRIETHTLLFGGNRSTKNILHPTHRWKRLLPISGSVSVAIETGCWGGKTALGVVYPKIILPLPRLEGKSGHVCAPRNSFLWFSFREFALREIRVSEFWGYVRTISYPRRGSIFFVISLSTNPYILSSVCFNT